MITVDRTPAFRLVVVDRVTGQSTVLGLAPARGPQGIQGIQGPQGDTGSTGATGPTGPTGQSAYTLTTAAYTQPAAAATVTVSVVSSAWLAVGSLVRTPGGDYEVTALPTSTSVTLENLGYPGAASPGATVASGSSITATGQRGATGETGATGAQGSQGAAGAAGSNGINGVDGINGSIVVDYVIESNVTQSGETTADGYTTSVSRVLCTGQSTASQNGVFVTGPSGWTRATDYDAANEVLQGRAIYVVSGKLRANTYWTLTTSGAITVGSTSLTYLRSTRAVALALTVSLVANSGTTTNTAIVTLPANFKLTRFLGRLSTASVGAGGTSTIKVGTTSGGAELLTAWAITGGTAAGGLWGENPAEVGSDLSNALGYETTYSTAKTIYVQVATTGANITAGVVTIYIFGFEL